MISEGKVNMVFRVNDLARTTDFYRFSIST